eukprot:1120897-Rhodomonas_salina.1
MGRVGPGMLDSALPVAAGREKLSVMIVNCFFRYGVCYERCAKSSGLVTARIVPVTWSRGDT